MSIPDRFFVAFTLQGQGNPPALHLLDSHHPDGPTEIPLRDDLAIANGLAHLLNEHTAEFEAAVSSWNQGHAF